MISIIVSEMKLFFKRLRLGEKMKAIAIWISSSLISAFLFSAVCNAEEVPKETAIAVTGDFTYKMGAGDTRKKASVLALFGAKLKAVNLAAKYLSHKGVLEHYENKQNEIFYLTTDEIQVSIASEKFDPQLRSYYVKITSWISPLDFIKAQIKDLALIKEEARFSYGKEMEQPVTKEIDPGNELSRAYRYIRKGHWRIAIIYLDHLQKKYPNWGEVFMARAIAFFAMDDSIGMINALRRACALENQEACSELSGLDAELL